MASSPRKPGYQTSILENLNKIGDLGRDNKCITTLMMMMNDDDKEEEDAATWQVQVKRNPF